MAGAGAAATAGATAAANGLWRLLLAPYAWGVAAAFWLVGCLLVLRPWRGVALAVTPLLLVLVPSRLGAWSLLPLALVLLWLGFLASAALRTDLSTPPRGRLAKAAAVAGALPLLHLLASFALLLVYSLGVAFAERGWRGPAEFAWNDYYPAGTRDHLLYRPAREALALGLAAGGAAARDWEPALDAAEVAELVPQRRPWGSGEVASWAGTRLAVRLDERGLGLFPGVGAGTGSTWLVPGPQPAAPLALLPLPDAPDGGALAVANLDGVAVAAVDGGALVTFVAGRRSERGFASARQTVWHVGDDGVSQLLVDRPLAEGAPAWLRHRGFLLSPVLQAAADLVRSAWFGVGPGAASVGDVVAHPPPPSIMGGALLLAVATAGVAWWLAGRRGLDANARRGWVIAALLLGPPLLFAMPLFTSRHLPET